MIDYSSVILDNVVVHHVGSKANDGELILSKKYLPIDDSKLKELLVQYFLSSFKSEEYYSFTFSNGDFSLNPLYKYAESIFIDQDTMVKYSADIAKHLFEASEHPNIKPGDLFIVHFTDLVFVDEIVNAIGIFKSENRHPFIKLLKATNDFQISYEDGINIEKLDKGCLIFNTEHENGFRVAIVDKSSKSEEARFWKDSFLMLKEADDNYHRTREIMSMAKRFIAKQLPEDIEMNNLEKMDLLNRSIDYFTENISFNREDFEDSVLKDKSIIRSFRDYNNTLTESSDAVYLDDFEISQQAVKKQAKMFKRVIKLDGNFHIYVHGDKDMIRQGQDPDGRRYYKLYYENES